MERRRRCPEGGTMKRILFGLGCTLAIAPGLFAQDTTPAARLGRPAATLGQPVAPIVRGQDAGLNSAGAFDLTPKTMPKGKVSESASPPLPMPTSAAPMPGRTGDHHPARRDGHRAGHYRPAGYAFPAGHRVQRPDGWLPHWHTCGTNDSGWYTSIEALAWWVKSYSVPALVTTGPAFSGATLDNPATAIQYGADSVDTNPRYGARFTLGYWLSPCWAVELSSLLCPADDRSLHHPVRQRHHAGPGPAVLQFESEHRVIADRRPAGRRVWLHPDRLGKQPVRRRAERPPSLVEHVQQPARPDRGCALPVPGRAADHPGADARAAWGRRWPAWSGT